MELQHPQKQSHGNQLIHRHLTKTKLFGRGSRSRESGRQTQGHKSWGGWGGHDHPRF